MKNRKSTLGTALVALTLNQVAFAQTFSNSTARAAPGPSAGSRPLAAGGAQCSLIDFEGGANNAPIGLIAGAPNVTFGLSWLYSIDVDAGGTGNFANEPTPDTTTYFLDPAEPIDFDSGVQYVEVHYSAGADSVPVTLTAWDGPGGSGNVVATVVGNTLGNSFDGADCVGDPNGEYCLWDVLQLSSVSNNILSVTLAGAAVDDFGFDNMTFCTSIPATGLCCTAGACTDTTEMGCTSLGGEYAGDDTHCGDIPCHVGGLAAIPAISEWGWVVLVLLSLTLGTVVFARSGHAASTA